MSVFWGLIADLIAAFIPYRRFSLAFVLMFFLVLLAIAVWTR